MAMGRGGFWILSASLVTGACTTALELDDYAFTAGGAPPGGNGGDGGSAGDGGSGGGVGGTTAGSGGASGASAGAAGAEVNVGGSGGGERALGESCDDGDACQPGLSCELGVCCPPGHLADAAGAACRPVLTSLVPTAVTPSDATLLEALDPALSGAQLTYDLAASFWLTQLSFAAEGPAGATVLINGTPLTAQSPPVVDLELGDNTVSITVQNAAGSREYFVRVQRRRPIHIPAPDAVASRFGHTVAAAGDILVVGAPSDGTGNSSVYTYRRTAPGVWEHVPDAVIRAPAAAETYGEALRFDGTTLAMGASSETIDTVDRSGAIHFYVQDADTWQQQTGSPAGVAVFALELGWRIDLAGPSAAATSNNNNELRTYSRSEAGDAWSEDPGSPLVAPDNIAFIEGAVALDGNVLAAGSHNANESPRVFLYERSAPGTPWLVPATGDTLLTAPGMFADDLALKGTTLVVNGDPVSVYERGGDGVWARTALPVSSLGPVALTDTSLVIGSAQGNFDDVTGGEIQVLRRNDPASPWFLDPVSPLATDVGAAEQFGISVAVSGRTVFAGASGEIPNGGVWIFE